MWASLKRFFRGGFLPLLFLTLLINSCGSGGGGGSSSVSVAGGGIGGTGVASGVITGFGSIVLGAREYDTQNAMFTVDLDDTATQNDLTVGMKVVITGHLTGTGGTAENVVYEPEIKGVLDSIDAANQLTVMGQIVQVDGTTKFGGNISNFSEIQVGDILEVSGFFDAAGKLRATYVEGEDPTTQTLEVKGTIADLYPMTFTFVQSSLTVDYQNVTNMVQIHKGDFVEVRGTLQGGILVADHMEMGMMTPQVGEDEEMELEGMITDLPALPDNPYYLLNGMSVEVTGSTTFEAGSEADLDLNVRIEVKGVVSGGVLVADEIEIKN